MNFGEKWGIKNTMRRHFKEETTPQLIKFKRKFGLRIKKLSHFPGEKCTRKFKNIFSTSALIPWTCSNYSLAHIHKCISLLCAYPPSGISTFAEDILSVHFPVWISWSWLFYAPFCWNSHTYKISFRFLRVFQSMRY